VIWSSFFNGEISIWIPIVCTGLNAFGFWDIYG
jgi:hypothetical protein